MLLALSARTKRSSRSVVEWRAADKGFAPQDAKAPGRNEVRLTDRIGPAAWISMNLALKPYAACGCYFYNKYRKKIALTAR